jgi:hypothetical protein
MEHHSYLKDLLQLNGIADFIEVFEAQFDVQSRIFDNRIESFANEGLLDGYTGRLLTNLFGLLPT